MLYADEKVENLYDIETGEILEKQQDKLERKEFLELKGKAQAFSAMIRSSGWKVFKADLEKKIEYFTEKLIFCETEKDICRLQEAVKIYRQVLAIPEYVIYLSNSYNQTPDEGDNQE